MPVLKILAKLGISPTFVTNFRVLVMIGFFYFLTKNLLIASLFYLFALLLDAIDGSLARLENNSSDRGKFLDMFSDNLLYMLFLLGLFILGIANSFLITYAIFITPILYLLAVIKKQEGEDTDWLIKPMAKVIYFKGIVNAIFMIYVLFNINYLTLTFWIINIIMTIMALYYYIHIQLRWKKWLFRRK